MPTAAPQRRRTKRQPPPAAPAPLSEYLRYSATPWAALLFVLPLLVLHEVAVAWFGGVPPTAEHRVTAFVLMARFLGAFGAAAPYLPAAALVAVLLAWHLATEEGGKGKGSWAVRPGAVAAMAGESALWAAPLIGVYLLCAPGRGWFDAPGDPKLRAAMYLGAGVYEEAVFRLAGFAVISLVLVDLGRVRQEVAVPIMVSTAAAGFAAYHMLGGVTWPWQAFVFTGLRGVYYGVIFLWRGFGVSVGVHTAYDILFLGLSELNRP